MFNYSKSSNLVKWKTIDSVRLYFYNLVMAKTILKNPKALKAKLNDYFKSCDPHIEETEIIDYKKDPAGVKRRIKIKTRQKPYTITGIASAIGLTTKEFKEIAHPSYISKRGKIKISPSCKQILLWAIQQVEHFAERNLYTPGKVQGSQFLLKNIGDWKDKVETESPGLTEAVASLEKSIASALKAK